MPQLDHIYAVGDCGVDGWGYRMELPVGVSELDGMDFQIEGTGSRYFWPLRDGHYAIFVETLYSFDCEYPLASEMVRIYVGQEAVCGAINPQTYGYKSLGNPALVFPCLQDVGGPCPTLTCLEWGEASGYFTCFTEHHPMDTPHDCCMNGPTFEFDIVAEDTPCPVADCTHVQAAITIQKNFAYDFNIEFLLSVVYLSPPP